MPQANSYVCYDDFFIRTPVLPLDFLDEIPSTSEGLIDFVKEKWRNPFIRNAILLASPSLNSQLDTEVLNDDPSPRIIYAFIRYYMRMCYRATPFGLFAGVGSGVISDKTNIRINDPITHKLKSRLDMEYLGTWVMDLVSNPDVIRELTFRANTSLYKIGLKWRYIEVYYEDNSRKKYRIVSVDSNDLIDQIITGSFNLRGWKDIVKQIHSIGYSNNESESFVNQLIGSQILIPDIYPNLTGKEYSIRLKEKLENLGAIQKMAVPIVSVLGDLEREFIPLNIENLYRRVNSQAEMAAIKYSSSRLIQADLLCSFKNCELSRELSNKILFGLRILKALSRPGPNKVLEDFKDHFFNRFGTREVPLPHVMDSDYGIALTGPEGQQRTDPSPLLDGIDYSRASQSWKPNPPHPLLLRKFEFFEGTKERYINLTRSEINELGIRRGKWPEQLFALCRLAGSVDNPSIVFDIASAGNPANVMGRFGFLDQDGQLGKHIKDILEDDKNSKPDHILAEVVHLPEDRTGNILQRPSYYDWEIPFLATPGREDRNIFINDILVSVEGSRITLKDRKTKRKILPRLTNAHNYSFGQLPVYQFLAECIHQDTLPGFFPEWGWLSARNNFLPGIKYENLILSLPMWRIRIDKKLKKLKTSDTGFYKIILEWVQEHSLPDRVIWINGDHEMVINWLKESIVMAAWDGIRKREVAVFRDYPYESGSHVSGTDGEYANEVVVTFKKEK